MLKEGTRVRLNGPVERFPHFIADAGMIGTVTEMSNDVVCVRMDEHLHGAETWDNEICWYLPQDRAALETDLTII